MDYRLRSTGEIVTEQAFRELHADKSLPQTLGAADLDYLGADEVLPVDPPKAGPEYKVERTGAEFVDGQWREAWAVVPFPPEVAAQRRAAAIAQAWAQIKAERDRRRFEGGVNVGGHWFLSTETATGEYNSLIILASAAGMPDATVLRAGWRTLDGAEVDMTPGLAKSILLAGFGHLKAIDDAAQAHRAAMEAAADPLAYDYSAGWPAIFGA